MEIIKNQNSIIQLEIKNVIQDKDFAFQLTGIWVFWRSPDTHDVEPG